MWKVGIHNCYWIGSGFERQEEALAAAARAGVDSYELPAVALADFSSSRRRELVRLAKELGLSLTANGGFRADNDIASADGRVRRRGIEDGCRIVEALAQMGITSWSGINYAAWKSVPVPGSTFSRQEREEAKKRSLDSLEPILRRAGDCGVTLCLEVVNRYEQFFLNTAEEGIAFARRTGSENCKLLLDSYHMNIEEANLGDALRRTAQAGLLGEVHVSEPDRRVPGTGESHMEWPGFFAALREADFNGTVTMEPFLIPELAISSKICIWRELAGGARGEELVRLVRTGADFIRSFAA